MKKYYDILGLPEGSSQEQIQKAYDKLSVDLNPKNNDNLDFFKEEFDLLNEAYSKLKDSTPKADSKTDLKDKEPKTTKEEKSPDDVTFGEDDSRSKKPKSKLKNKKLDEEQSKRYKKCPNNHFYSVELDDCPACLIEAKHLSNKEADNSDKSEAPSSGDSDKNSKSKPKEPKPNNEENNSDAPEELTFGESDDNSNENSQNSSNARSTPTKKDYSWWSYDDEYISGWTYFGRSILGALLAAFLIGLYLNSVTAYKRARSLGHNDSATLWGVWGFLTSILAFTPLVLITNTFPHWYLWFSNGKNHNK